MDLELYRPDVFATRSAGGLQRVRLVLASSRAPRALAAGVPHRYADKFACVEAALRAALATLHHALRRTCGLDDKAMADARSELAAGQVREGSPFTRIELFFFSVGRSLGLRAQRRWR